MKSKFLWLIALAALSLNSCGGCAGKQEVAKQNKTVEIKPYNIKIKGYLSSVLEVVDGVYRFELTDDLFTKGIMQVKIKTVKRGDNKDYGFRDGNGGPLYLTLCDTNGVPFADFSDIRSNHSADGLLKDMVGKVGEENWIKFEAFIENTDANSLPEEIATFIITSKKIEEDGSVASNNGIDDDEDLMSGAGDKKWDKLLNDYEKYVDQYLKILAKANKGDMSALSDVQSLLSKAENLETSLSNANEENSLSTKQINRMIAIQEKMINAALTITEEKPVTSTNKSKNTEMNDDDDDDDDDDD
jgi:hypothetical protein